MTNFFSITANNSLRITDGSNYLDLNSDGDLNLKGNIKTQSTSGVTTSRTDTYTVPAGKFWIVKRISTYRTQTGMLNILVVVDSVSENIIWYPTAELYSTTELDLKLKAGDSVGAYMKAGTSGTIASMIVYEEHNA